MARRARQGLSMVHIAIGVGTLGAAAVAASVLFALNASKDSMRSVSELDLAEYIKKGDSMGGTVWKLTGKIDGKMRWTADRGQMVSVLVEQGGLRESLPVLVPPEFNDINVNIGDRFTMKVEVADKLVLTVRDLRRS